MAQQKLAIDFDSVYTNIYMLGGGLVLSEPTVAAVGQDAKHEVKAVGDEAKKLIGKTAKNTKIVFPVFEGEIVNEKVAVGLLGTFLNKIDVKNSFFGCQALFSVPCGVTSEMIEKYKKVAKNCGISKVFFAEAPLLSALGQRIPLNDSTPCFIIDMAGGTTNIAAVSLDGVIAGISVNFGANKISTDIIDYLAENYGLQIGLLTAERLKKEIGSLDEFDALATVVNGRDLKTGAPKSISLKAKDIIIPTKKYFDKIAELAQTVLKKLPPEVSAEIRHAGIYVSGIGSTVYGLDKYYGDIFDMQINVADNGLMSVALGGGVAIGDNDLLKKIILPV
ncbi:MAG: rod shape-determining protein [Clostridia bacterium]|nr:rod shape-determining protein [Clostridia bacterium]MBR2448881.1 rod shape-determining protein [Clostridia bacterium]